MDNSKALVRLTESADLLAMVEELMAAQAAAGTSPATLAGIRITLRGVREAILSSHDTLAADFISRARSSGLAAPASAEASEPRIHHPNLANRMTNLADSKAASQEARIVTGRKDLRATVEQVSSS